MRDTIYRDDAIKELRLEYSTMMPLFKDARKEWSIRTEGYRKAEEVIMKLPSADRPQSKQTLSDVQHGENDREKTGDLIERSEVIEAIKAETWLGLLECQASVLIGRIEAIPSADKTVTLNIKGIRFETDEDRLLKELERWFDRNPGKTILIERDYSGDKLKHTATIETMIDLSKLKEAIINNGHTGKGSR